MNVRFLIIFKTLFTYLRLASLSDELEELLEELELLEEVESSSELELLDIDSKSDKSSRSLSMSDEHNCQFIGR